MSEETINKIKKALSEYFGVELSEIQYDADYKTFTINGIGEFLAYTDHKDAVNEAVEICKDFIDVEGIDGINFEAIGGIDQYLDRKWFDDAMHESYQQYVDDIVNEIDHVDENGKEVTRLQVEMKESETETIPDFIEKLCDADSIKWCKDSFGKEMFDEIITSNDDILDIDKLAEAIVETDGAAAQLATYDGVEIELTDNIYAYRVN